MTEPPVPTSNKQACNRDDALAVLRRLREAGHVAYFAGGCVRDELLGITPTDFDVATDAPPTRVRELFSNTQAVGAAFGVILVRQRRSVIEVATFRSDDIYLDGRRPSKVHFTTAEEDAKRRDFTINGLFLDPLTNEVIDYVGGRADLSARILRAIGEPNHRFEEDHLRLLRAIRFASRFDLAIEPATADAIKRHATHLKRISPERIADELRRMTSPPARARAWEMLWHFGLIDVVFRHLHLEPGGALVRERSILCVDPQRPMSFGQWLAEAVLCCRWQRGGFADIRTFLGRDAAVSAVHALRQGLKISNDESDELREILTSLAIFLADQPPSLAAKKRFLATRFHRSSMQVMQAIAGVGEHVQQIEPLLRELKQLQSTDFAPVPLVTGDDLTAAGLKPGKLFKQILDEVYDAQLESRVCSKDDAMTLALKIAKM